MTSQQSLGMASAPSLGGAGDGGSFGNAMALNVGPPMGSVGSTQDLQDLYRRYSSMPMQPSPPRMLSMHDSAGSFSLDEVGRSAALPGVYIKGLHVFHARQRRSTSLDEVGRSAAHVKGLRLG